MLRGIIFGLGAAVLAALALPVTVAPVGAMVIGVAMGAFTALAAPKKW